MTNMPPFLRFCIVGASGVVVNSAVLALLYGFFGFPIIYSSMWAILTAMCWNFYWNDNWTFDAPEDSTLPKRVVMFISICVIGAGINMVMLTMLTGEGVYYLLANLCGIAVATVWNYAMNKKVTWG